MEKLRITCKDREGVGDVLGSLGYMDYMEHCSNSVEGVWLLTDSIESMLEVVEGLVVECETSSPDMVVRWLSDRDYVEKIEQLKMTEVWENKK